MPRARSLILASAAVVLAAGLATASRPASAQALALGALPPSAVSAASGGIEQVQYRRGWGPGPGWGGRGWGPGPGWGGRPGWGGPGWGPGYYAGWGPRYYAGWGPGWGYGYNYGWGPAFATGVIIGSAVAVPPPPPPNWYAYCAAKYRSFDPRTGTFLGYDGRRHPCR